MRNRKKKLNSQETFIKLLEYVIPLAALSMKQTHYTHIHGSYCDNRCKENADIAYGGPGGIPHNVSHYHYWLLKMSKLVGSV